HGERPLLRLWLTHAWPVLTWPAPARRCVGVDADRLIAKRGEDRGQFAAGAADELGEARIEHRVGTRGPQRAGELFQPIEAHGDAAKRLIARGGALGPRALRFDWRGERAGAR